MNKTKRIGILTSGGDCPGLNAAIRAVIAHASLTFGWEVVGIPYATDGLRDRQSIPLNVHGLDFRGIDLLLSTGGTILGSINKGDTATNSDKIISGYHDLGLDALIAIGGDGSLKILHDLAQKGNWKLVAIPKTIDNDVSDTERSVGFDTAVNTITDALQRLTFTASSHDRVMVVEVMGRDAGHLALNAGIAGGANVILIPEIPYSIHNVCSKLAELREKWNCKFAIVVVAEGAKTKEGESRVYTDSHGQVRLRGIGDYIGDQIAACSNNQVETRVTVLGHVQRGGIPTALDRLIATAFGKAAVDLVAQEDFGKMVAWQNRTVISVPLHDVFVNSPLLVDPSGCLVKTAIGMGIYVGDLETAPIEAPTLVCAG